jgi:hypothetical protein
MKRLAIVVTIGVVIMVGITLLSSEVKYTSPEVVEVEKEVEVDALEQAIKSSQNAKMSEIEAVAQQAYNDAKDREMKKIELEVITEFNKKLEERKIELQKETRVY